MNQATLFVPKRSTFILRCLFYPRALKCKWLGLPVAPSKPSKTPTKQILRNNIFSAQAASKQLAHSSFQVFRNCRSDPTSSSLIVLQKANDRCRKNRVSPSSLRFLWLPLNHNKTEEDTFGHTDSENQQLRFNKTILSTFPHNVLLTSQSGAPTP